MRLDYTTDHGAAARARFGLVVLQVDETIEDEFPRLVGRDGIAVHFTRVRSGKEVTGETLAAQAADLPVAAALLPPGVPFDVIGYACTSGATVIGPENVARAVRAARPDDFATTRVTDPLTAVGAACRALGVRRLGFVTPYVAEVSTAMRTALEADGLEIAGFGSFEQAEERVVARISPGSIERAVVEVGRSEPCDAVFVSCTNARTLDVIETAEQRLGLPVLSSTQALAWHMLLLAGIEARRPGCGRLFAG
ncbi:MAG: Asp/Glu racemase [Gammaproteobacteria bacterium]|nr:Asp/Glu racemase [Gammaproteobacteria bacterium]